MRVLVVLGLFCATARADEAVRSDAAAARADDGRLALIAGVAVGAGGQDAASYGALELRLDAEWRGERLGRFDMNAPARGGPQMASRCRERIEAMQRLAEAIERKRLDVVLEVRAHDRRVVLGRLREGTEL